MKSLVLNYLKLIKLSMVMNIVFYTTFSNAIANNGFSSKAIFNGPGHEGSSGGGFKPENPEAILLMDAETHQILRVACSGYTIGGDCKSVIIPGENNGDVREVNVTLASRSERSRIAERLWGNDDSNLRSERNSQNDSCKMNNECDPNNQPAVYKIQIAGEYCGPSQTPCGG